VKFAPKLFEIRAETARIRKFASYYRSGVSLRLKAWFLP